MTTPAVQERLSRPILVAILLAVPVIAWTFFIMGREELPADASASTPITARNRTVTVGGVPRPASDVGSGHISKRHASNNVEIDPSERLIFGQVPALQPDANPTVARVAEALRDGSAPEQLSPMIAPNKFNREAYIASPESYLAVHVPGRAFQSAQPGPDIPVLQRVGSGRHVIRQGETVRLKVQTESGMPATFTSFDIGTFANGLTSISVAADEQGIAEAAYFGAPGKVGEVNILAASPVAAEQVKFQVWILPPN